MINKKAIHDELIQMFIEYQYASDNPMLQVDMPCQDKMAKQYRDNPLFNAKVRSLVGAVMLVVSRHENN